jgi:hypothetical protein
VAVRNGRTTSSVNTQGESSSSTTPSGQSGGGGSGKAAKAGKQPARAAETLLAEAAAALSVSGAGDAAAQWACAVCTLHNASGSLRCAACMTPRPSDGKRAEEEDGAAAAAGAKAKKAKKAKKGVSVRLTGGDGQAANLLNQLNGGGGGPTWGR